MGAVVLTTTPLIVAVISSKGSATVVEFAALKVKGMN